MSTDTLRFTRPAPSRHHDDFDASIKREWLETNGLGGFASGTVLGIHTRRYHGLLTGGHPASGGARAAALEAGRNAGGERGRAMSWARTNIRA